MSWHKYSAQQTGKYASKREAGRAAELHALDKAGIIRELEEQKRFVLIEKDELGRAIEYWADFHYWDVEAGKWVTEDVKGYRTREYKLKRRLMWAKYKILIQEV